MSAQEDAVVEAVARAICYRSNKTRVWDDGSVHDGCPSDLDCREAGICREAFNLLRCKTSWQTAHAAILAYQKATAGARDEVIEECALNLEGKADYFDSDEHDDPDMASAYRGAAEVLRSLKSPPTGERQ